MAAHKPERCIILQRPHAALRADRRPRHRLGGGDGRRRRRMLACRSRRPIRSTSSTPPARPASPRASCATMAATPWRSPGPWRTSTASSRARCSGPPPMSAGWSAIPTSSTRRCSMAHHRCSTRASRSARPMPAPSGASSPSTRSVTLFTAPTAFRAIKRDDPDGRLIRGHDLVAVSAACSWPASAPTRRRWNGRRSSCEVPVIDHWWQTETGWPMAANCLRHRAAAGQARLADQGGAGLGRPRPRWRRARGEAAARPAPSSPGCRCRRAPADAVERRRALHQTAICKAFPGYYQTGDAGFIDEDGYIYVMARTDDIINVAGHRLSTGAMEEVLAAHPDVAECAVIGVADELKGQVPLGFLVLKAGVAASRCRDRAARSWRWCATASARWPPSRSATVVKRLPKTRSGKILRGTMQKIADGDGLQDAGDHRRSGDPAGDRRGADGRWAMRRKQNRRPHRTTRDGPGPVPFVAG